MEKIKNPAVLGWAITIISSLSLFIVGIVGFLFAELWRTVKSNRKQSQDNREAIANLKGEHDANINRCKPKR